MNALVAALLPSCALLGSCTRPVRLTSAPDGVPHVSADAGAPRVTTREPDEEPGGLLGSWSGLGRQSDGGSWLLRVDISSRSGRCATASYPSVPCTATWDCIGAEDAGGWREATEHIVDGSCVDGGTFRYRQHGDTLEWKWSKKSRLTAEDGLTAEGIMNRQQGKSPDANWDTDLE